MRVAVKKAILRTLGEGALPEGVLPLVLLKPKKIKVTDMLNIGIVMCGKLPDIYWNMDLTQAELRILHYVYDNVLRIYTSIKGYPRNKEGSPMFWRGKELMAADCGVTPTTFRQSIRGLAEKGLVTSMESSAEDMSEFCVGLSLDFVGKEDKVQLLKGDKKNRYNKLAEYLYKRTSLAYIKLTTDNPFQRFIEDEETVRDEIRGRYNWFARKRVSIHGERVPRLYIPLNSKRVSVKVPKSMVQLIEEERKKYEYVLSPYERRVMEVKKYYEYKCRNAINSSGYCVLSTKKSGWRDNKRWKWLTRLYKQCKDNGWDYKVFIDAQFDRLKWFKSKQKYVYLNQFFSEGAIKYYHRYVKDYKACNSWDGNIKIKTDKPQSFVKDVAEAVVKDCDRILEFIRKAPRYPGYRDLSATQQKIMYISQSWTSLSKYYLADIPWFVLWMRSVPASPTVDKVKKEILEIQGSKAMLSKVHRIVTEVELELKVPKTLDLPKEARERLESYAQ